MLLSINRLLLLIGIAFAGGIVAISGGCASTNEDVLPFDPDSIRAAFFDRIIPFNLDETQQGWEGSFGSYVSSLEDSLDLSFEYVDIPENFEVRGKGLKWSGYNYQNTLFMYGYRRIANLQPNTRYLISYDVGVGYIVEQGNEFALRDHEDKLNIKVGAINYQPESNKDEVLGKTLVNFDKGAQQTTDGKDMIWLGEVVVGDLKYKDKISKNADQRLFEIETNANGEFWALIGVDSSVPLKHSVYFDTIILYLKQEN